MPDKHGFDHLGDSPYLRCIWCGMASYAWRDESERARHARKHQKDQELARAEREREREKINRILW